MAFQISGQNMKCSVIGLEQLASHLGENYAPYKKIYFRWVKITMKKMKTGTSLVAQWLRVRLPMQGTRVRALVQEDPTCHGATKPVRHYY